MLTNCVLPMNKLIIREWAEADRPREKLMEHGRRALTDAELLAILIGSGSRDETAVELCKRILKDQDHDLHKLFRLEVSDFCKYKGIGEAKAISIVAALELGRRRKEEKPKEKPILNSSNRIYKYFGSRLKDLPHEEFWAIYMNRACKLLESQLIGRGGNDSTPVDVRTILRYALQNNASSIVLAHNHPSGTLAASEADQDITKKICTAARLMDIRVVDHVIFTDNGYYSMRDEGYMI